AGDHAMTRGTLLLRAGDPPDWLDRSGLGPTDYLQLPGGSAHYGWVLETWNRSFRRAIQMGLPGYDGYASYTGRVDREGRFLVDGGLKRTVWVGPGQRKLVLIPVRGYPVPALRIRTDRADYVDGGTPNARLVAIRIPSLSYVTERSRN